MAKSRSNKGRECTKTGKQWELEEDKQLTRPENKKRKPFNPSPSLLF
jgi:hypothetical protein